MPFDGNGTYTPPSPYYPAVSGSVIYANDFNQIMADIAAAISNAITKDGQQTVTANIPMAGFVFTGLGAGGANGQSLRYEQVYGPAISLNALTVASLTSTGAITLNSRPIATANNTLVPDTFWVQYLITQPFSQAADVPLTDYSNRIATTKFVVDKNVPPTQIPMIAMLLLDQWT